MLKQGEDARMIALMEHAVENLREHAEKTLEDCRQILKYGEQTENEMYLGFAHYYSGEAYYTLNNVEKVLYHISQALGYLERAGAWELVARAYNLTGITSIAIGNAAFAMNYYVQALSCCRRFGLRNFENTVSINIGMLYYSYGEYDKAGKYFSDSLRYLEAHPDTQDRYLCIAVVCIGLGRCALHTGDVALAQKYDEKIREVCVPQINVENYSYLTFQTVLYHACGDAASRDACMQRIHESLNGQIQIMDYFEDLYEYAGLLLDINEQARFLELVGRLEELAVQAKVINLQHRIRELKLRYYSEIGDQDAYLKEAALFYEDTVRMNRSNRAMVRGMMDICLVLEEERQEKSQIVAQNHQLAEKSETDALTGLPNRFRLDWQSGEQFAKAAREQLPLAVEILDIDYFKQYNDNYGHQNGDRCIMSIAQAIAGICRYDGVSAYRYGGDEFVILYLGLAEEQVKMIAQELREQIHALHITHAYSVVSDIATVSQGICFGYPAQGQQMSDYLHMADRRLYDVKKSDRGNILLAQYEQ